MKTSISSQVQTIRESGLFDDSWYLFQYPDVGMLKIDPIEHYIKIGHLLGRNPSPSFSGADYWGSVAKLSKGMENVDPLSHYLSQPKPKKKNQDGQLSELIAIGLKFVDAKNFFGFFHLRSILVDSNNIKYSNIVTYLDAIQFSRRGGYQKSLKLAREVLHNVKVRKQFTETELLRIRILEAMLLGRMGMIEDARSKLEAIPDVFKNSAPALAYLDIVWRKEPERALRTFSRVRREGIALPFNYRLLELCLKSGTSGPERVKILTAEFLQKSNLKTKQRSELILLMANLAGSQNDVSTQKEFFEEFWRCYDLPTPTIGDGPVRLASIVNGSVNIEKNGPLVTVVITTFNSEATVTWAVESILAQSHGNLELIVVDDRSSDGTPELLSKFAERDSRVRVLFNSENVGTYNSKNRAISASNGEFITCLDSDDWAHPHRLEFHLREMAANPDVIVTRSKWVRISDNGEFMMTRWAKAFLHDNPASAFIRRSVFEQIGLFDTVRTGADTEFWNRIITVFGNDRALSLSSPLTLGLRHEASLTTSGAAALNEEQFSPIRDEYSENWIMWHQESRLSGRLSLPNQHTRRFPAPLAITPDSLEKYLMGYSSSREWTIATPKVDEIESGIPEFVFAIPLAAAEIGDWEHTCRMLRSTLRSILGQSNPHFRAIICGHDKPQLEEMNDPRVEWLISDQSPPAPGKYRVDKARKRVIIAHRLRQLGGGYFMFLDADDLVSRHLVAHVRETRDANGYSVRRGYAMDWLNNKIAPVPGVWDSTFDQVCGSSAIFYFSVEDLPCDLGKNAPSVYFDEFSMHGYWRTAAHENGRSLRDIPFPAVIYVLNHAQNLSFSLQRGSIRQSNICRLISENAINPYDAIESDFSLTSQESAENIVYS